jgi:hypothetical protein
LRQFLINHLLHGIWKLQDVIIGKANDSDPFAHECFSTLLVILLASIVVVLTTIGFDAKTRRQATKVNDEAGNGYLSAKVIPIELPAAKKPPKLLLRVRWRFSHLPRERQQSSALVAPP